MCSKNVVRCKVNCWFSFIVATLQGLIVTMSKESKKLNNKVYSTSSLHRCTNQLLYDALFNFSPTQRAYLAYSVRFFFSFFLSFAAGCKGLTWCHLSKQSALRGKPAIK